MLFLTQFRPQTICNCLLYLAHFWDLIMVFRVGCLYLYLTCSKTYHLFSNFVCELGRSTLDTRSKQNFASCI